MGGEHDTKTGELSPLQELLTLIPVRKDDVVADVGAGTGYFSIPAAKMTESIVYAIDSDHNALEMLELRTKKEYILNIQVRVGSAEDLPLQNHTTDLVIVSMVLHEVTSLTRVVQEIHRILKPMGRLLWVECEPMSVHKGLISDTHISSADVRIALSKAGFSIEKRFTLAEYLYALVAHKPRL